MSASQSADLSALAEDYAPPIPIELPTPGRTLVAQRLIHTLSAGGRFLLPAAGQRLMGGGDSNDSMARAVRLIFQELGATYVKFGQFLGSAPDIVGEKVALEFRRCLDTGPPLTPAAVRTTLEKDLGRPLEQAFAHFEATPFAAASVAVVHRASLLNGQRVAVKVLRPDVDAVVAADLALMQPAARFFGRQGSEVAANLFSYLIGLREQVAEELAEVRIVLDDQDVFGLRHECVPSALESSRLRTLDGLGRRCHQRQHSIELAAAQHLSHSFARPGDDQSPSCPLHLAMGGQQHADAGGANQVHAGEIDHDRAGAQCLAGEARADRVHAIVVEVACELEHAHAVHVDVCQSCHAKGGRVISWATDILACGGTPDKAQVEGMWMGE